MGHLPAVPQCMDKPPFITNNISLIVQSIAFKEYLIGINDAR